MKPGFLYLPDPNPHHFIHLLLHIMHTQNLTTLSDELNLILQFGFKLASFFLILLCLSRSSIYFLSSEPHDISYYKDEPELRCVQVPRVNCQELNRQSCQQVPVKDCQPKSRRVCSLVPTTSTKEVNDRKCTDNFRQVCNPVPKQVN